MDSRRIKFTKKTRQNLSRTWIKIKNVLIE